MHVFMISQLQCTANSLTIKFYCKNLIHCDQHMCASLKMFTQSIADNSPYTLFTTQSQEPTSMIEYAPIYLAVHQLHCLQHNTTIQA